MFVCMSVTACVSECVCMCVSECEGVCVRNMKIIFH